MTDTRLRMLQRQAHLNQNDSQAVWAYVRELERLQGISLATGYDVVVPFSLCVYGEENFNYIFGTIFSSAFIWIPFTRHYSNESDIWPDLTRSKEIPFVHLTHLAQQPYSERISGYAVVDSSVIDHLRKHSVTQKISEFDYIGQPYDTAVFKIAFCVAVGREVRFWKYQLYRDGHFTWIDCKERPLDRIAEGTITLQGGSAGDNGSGGAVTIVGGTA